MPPFPTRCVYQVGGAEVYGAGSAEAELASTPTPGPPTAMRRSDRAVAVIARHTPWILRGMVHLAPAIGRS
jgi:hypothetical protein